MGQAKLASKVGGGKSGGMTITENIFTWTRGSAQTAQITNIDISDYDYLRVYADYTNSQQSSTDFYVIIPIVTTVNKYFAIANNASGLNGACTSRTVYSSNGKLAYGLPTGTGSVGCIIYKIDGIKGTIEGA